MRPPARRLVRAFSPRASSPRWRAPLTSAGWCWRISRRPKPQELKLEEPLRVYTRDGKLMGEFGASGAPAGVCGVPPNVIHAFLAAEDDRFFQHPGVDWQGLARAGYKLVTTGEKTQGGSTITMQLARNVFLSPERTFTRKAREIALALQIEHDLTKEQILELYLNKIFLGNRPTASARRRRSISART